MYLSSRRELRAPVRCPHSPPCPALPAHNFGTSPTRTIKWQQPQRYFSSRKHTPGDKAENKLQSHILKYSCTYPVTTQCCSFSVGREQRLQCEAGKHSKHTASVMWLWYLESCFQFPCLVSNWIICIWELEHALLKGECWIQWIKKAQYTESSVIISSENIMRTVQCCDSWCYNK